MNAIFLYLSTYLPILSIHPSIHEVGLFIYFAESHKERERQLKTNLPSVGSLLKSDLDQVEARNQKLHLHLLIG